MTFQFTILGRLPGMNDMISSQHGKPWWMAANAKKDGMNQVGESIIAYKVPKFNNPVSIHIRFIEQNGRRDRDNVTSGGTKVILDAMKHLEIIKNDTRKWVTNITTDTTEIDKDNPRVEVTVGELSPLGWEGL